MGRVLVVAWGCVGVVGVVGYMQREWRGYEVRRDGLDELGVIDCKETASMIDIINRQDLRQSWFRQRIPLLDFSGLTTFPLLSSPRSEGR